MQILKRMLGVLPPLRQEAVSESTREAGLSLQNRFVALCVAASPPLPTIQQATRISAPAEFLRLTRHPLIKTIAIEKDALILETAMVRIAGKKIGEYVVIIAATGAESVLCFNTSITPTWSTSHVNGPHVNEGGKICMFGDARMRMNALIKAGQLAETAYMVLDILQQSNGTPYISVDQWPNI